MAKYIHFLGIGGSGASAAAAIAEAQGFEITGCDLQPDNEFTTGFDKQKIFSGHDPKHLACNLPGCNTNIDILAVTPAIFSLDANNPELLEAKKKNIPILTWQQFVGQVLTKDKFVIAVAGTHGKSTTTAMIADILEDANLDPTVLFGAIHPKWKANFRIGKGGYFVIEADEFNDNFLHLNPDITVITNIEMDHPEYFEDFNAYKESFKRFLLKTKSTIVANMTDQGVAEVLKVAMKENATTSIDYSKNVLGINLKIPGDYNKLNAQAAMQLGLLLGIDPQIIKESLAKYSGVGRRFEYIGEYMGAKVYSDFGHHPTEIKTTINAAREKFPNQRIILIYQPHMFTRTKYLFDDFVKVLKDLPVDKVFIIDIYQSREKDLGEVSSKQLAEAVNKDSVQYIGKSSEVLEKLNPEIKEGDILFFMSAGDTDKLAKELVNS